MEIIIAMNIAFILGALIRKPVFPKRKPKPSREQLELEGKKLIREYSEAEAEDQHADENKLNERISRQLESLLNYTGESEE